MKRTDAAIKVRANNIEKANVKAEVNSMAITTMAIGAGLVGGWVVSAFVGGIVASGGLMPLVSNWLQAVIG